ncbi:hypothetical protein [Streptomyces goshikiensis]|uniref:hypothetical protein n=1 Tax=Streptomyces goshikiensis TaxID=1942 RepID=UPI00368599B4
MLVMYGCFTVGKPDPEAVARVLAAAFGVSLRSVDVSLENEMGNRNWGATVSCDYAYLTGDLACNLSVYGADEVRPQPSEEELARALARGLGTVVLTSWGNMPWIRKVVTPQGGTTFARVEFLEGEGEGCLVTATETALAAFPQAVVEKFPEVVRGFPVATPLADGLLAGADRNSPAGDVRDLVWAWEALISRMAAHWSPSNWYGAAMYREDLENRDRLAAAVEALPADERAQAEAVVESLDGAFREGTADDGGRALAAALDSGTEGFASAPWYWRRRPVALPWETQE